MEFRFVLDEKWRCGQMERTGFEELNMRMNIMRFFRKVLFSYSFLK